MPYFSPNKWEVNLISEDLMFKNDYAYVSNKQILGFLKGDVLTANPKKGISGINQSNVLDYSLQHSVSYRFENDLLGPSVSLKQKINDQTFRLGIFTRLRTQGSVKDLDNYMRFSNQNLPEPAEYSFNSVKTNFMNWSEIGFHISTNYSTNATNEIIIGANLNYLIGLDAAIIDSKNPIKLEAKPSPTSTLLNPKLDIFASNYDIKASYSTNYDFDRDQYVYRNRGNGASLNLGIAWVKRRMNDELYDFKFAVNLLDVGAIRFKGENHHFYNPAQKIQIKNNPKIDDFENIAQYLQQLSKEIYGNTTQSKVGENFTVGLPTSLHFNMSTKIRPSHYWNINLIQRTPVFKNSLKRTNILQTSYSIQKDAFGIGPSLSLYDYEKITFGGYVRIGPLILGSDNALPFVFKQKKLNAANFYFALKLYPFWDNETKRRSREPCNCE